MIAGTEAPAVELKTTAAAASATSPSPEGLSPATAAAAPAKRKVHIVLPEPSPRPVAGAGRGAGTPTGGHATPGKMPPRSVSVTTAMHAYDNVLWATGVTWSLQHEGSPLGRVGQGKGGAGGHVGVHSWCTLRSWL